ncbi:hypothetical protein [Pseudofrankia sp. BMG5.37]|uniref:hypothetical protein n=1 Tax=Pseudofrankia sp. BMG5.37 TaxID=3050035 RepID=UPI002893CA90|nr:hypothetical protein [Pseudofrankia sp. BMG5.37]MDT3438325.1 hypothetical protein [Pseudofrankia sp. BMG5.37]
MDPSSPSDGQAAEAAEVTAEPEAGDKPADWDYRTDVTRGDLWDVDGVQGMRRATGWEPRITVTRNGDRVEFTAATAATAQDVIDAMCGVPARARLVGSVTIVFTLYGSGFYPADGGQP